MSNGYSQYTEYAPVPYNFAQSVAAPPMSAGRRMGHTGEGANIAGLVGIQDPAMSLAINQLLQPVLTGFIGGNYVPAQFSAGGNLYSQMKMGDTLRNSSRAMDMAAQMDQRGIYERIRGTARLMGQPFGAREQAAASEMAATMGQFVPMAAQMAPDLVDKSFGLRGSATVMAQNMFRGGRYAIDPVTGKRGYSAETAADITKGVYNRLYGDNADISQMSGITAGRAGQLFDEMQRRGMMPNTTSRASGMKQIAEQMNTTIADVSNMPDLDRKLRELDANKISDKLKGMSKAVSAMQEIFGEMGDPDAPMSQLVGAIETLTQANMQNMDPAKLETMIRTTSATAKAAGIEMPEMFKIMGSTAAYADRANVNRAMVSDLTSRSVVENQAMKNMFGGIKSFGVPTADKMMDLQQQLNVQSARDPRTYEIANVARAVEQFGVKPEKGSELEAVYNAIKDPTSKGEYKTKDKQGNEITKSIFDIVKQPGGLNKFMLDQKVEKGVLTSMMLDRQGAEEYIDKYKIHSNIARPMQTDRVSRELSSLNQYAIKAMVADEDIMAGVSPEVKAALAQSGKSISAEVTESLFSLDAEGIEKADQVSADMIRARLKTITGKDLTAEDEKVVTRLAGAFKAEGNRFFRNRGMVNQATGLQLLSKKVQDQAALDQANINLDVQFESKMSDLGKSSFLQRMSEFVRTADSDTSVDSFMASAFNYQPIGKLQERFGEDFAKVRDLAKGFTGYKAEDTKLAYIKDAISVNEAALAQPGITDEKREQLNKEASILQSKLVDLGLTTKDKASTTYKEFADSAKKAAGGDINKAAAQASKNLNEFKQKYGVTAQEARDLNIKHLNYSGRKGMLDLYKEHGEKLGLRLNAAGVLLGVGANRDINEAVSLLNKGEAADIDSGLSLAQNFLDNYGLSPNLFEKGGQEGIQLKDKAQSLMNVFNRAAESLGISRESLLAGDMAGVKGLDLGTLKADAAEDVNVLKSLSTEAKDQKRYSEVVKSIEQQRDALSAKTDGTEQEKAARARKIERLDRAAKVNRDDISNEYEKALGRQEALSKQDQASLDKAFEGYKKTVLAAEQNTNAVNKFVAEINKGREKGSEITINDMAVSVAPEEKDLKEVQDLRSKLYDTKDPVEAKKINDKIKGIIKDSGLSESSFNVLKEEDKKGLRKLLEESAPMSAAEADKLASLRKEVGDKVDNADKLFTETDRKTLEGLKSKSKVIDSGITPDSDVGKEFKKYSTFNDLKNDKKDKEKVLALADQLNIRSKAFDKSKNDEITLDRLEKKFTEFKAQEAGITSGQGFEMSGGKIVAKRPSSVSDAEKEQIKTLEKRQKDADEILKNLDPEKVKEFKELAGKEARQGKGLPPEKLKEFAEKSGMSQEQVKEYFKIEEDREKILSAMPKEQQDKARALLKEGKTAEANKIMASEQLMKFDSRAVLDKTGDEAFKKLTASSKQQLVDTMNSLNMTVTSGGSPLSKSQKEAVEDSAKLGTANLKDSISFFKDKLKAAYMGDNEGSDFNIKLAGRSGKGIRQVGSLLRMGMAQAGQLANLKDDATPEAQTQALHNLLTQDPSKLNDKQKALRTSLINNRITSDLFGGEDGKKVLDSRKILSLGESFAKDMDKKKALSKEETKGGPTVVTFAEGAQVKMSGVVRVDGGDSTLTATAANVRPNSRA